MCIHYRGGYIVKVTMGWLDKFTLRKNSKENTENNTPSAEELMKKRAERERRRKEYESRYMNVRPAKLMKGNYSREDVFQIDESSSSGKDERIKRLIEQQKIEEEKMNKEFPHRHKAVDKEAELRKAHELQKQLEEEEEARYQKFLQDNRD